MAAVEVLKLTHAIDERVRGIEGTVTVVDDKVTRVDDRVAGIDDRIQGVSDPRYRGLLMVRNTSSINH